MVTPNREASKPNRAQPERLDESNFIRNKLFGQNKSSFATYRDLVFHTFTWPKLIRYELLTTFVGPLPGALGLVLRKRLYRKLFGRVGAGTIFGSNLTLRHTDRITLGHNVFLDRDCVLDARGAGDDGIVIGDRVIVNAGVAIQCKVGHIAIGADCNIGAHSDIVTQGPIIIEENVSIAGKVMICGGRYVVEQDEERPQAKDRFSGGPIRIGRNARIGMAAIIQDGVTIGENAIVAPGSVVFENVPANAVVWGNPARLVRNRKSEASGKEGGKASRANMAGAANAEVQEKVCEYLKNDLFVEFGPGAYSTKDSLIDSGIIDSLALVRLLLWIEETFDVDLDFSGLDPAEIDSVEKIVARINNRK
jgi:acetyltransferase-like isoleucine patch superfamily enzyme/acyl carrier protein